MIEDEEMRVEENLRSNFLWGERTDEGMIRYLILIFEELERRWKSCSIENSRMEACQSSIVTLLLI